MLSAKTVQIAYNQISQSSVYKQSETATTITVCGGTYGGGSEVLVVYSVDMGDGKSNCVISENIVPTLAATHYGEPVGAYEKESNRP